MSSRFVVMLVLVLGAVGSASGPSDQSTSPPNDKDAANEGPARKTFVYRLRNASAEVAAQSINEKIAELLKSQPPVVLVPEINTNSLVISAATPYAEKVKQIIRDLDKDVAKIMIQAKLTRIGPDGKPVVISRPQIMTLDGTRAVVEVGNVGGESYRLELTPHLITSDKDIAAEKE